MTKEQDEQINIMLDQLKEQGFSKIGMIQVMKGMTYEQKMVFLNNYLKSYRRGGIG